MMYYLLVTCSVFVAACAQMLLKKGAMIHYDSFIRQYMNGWVISGYGIMFATMAVNVFAMSKGVLVNEVSIIESLSYLFVPCLSRFFFKEELSWQKVVMIGVIMCGVVVFFA